MAPIWQRNNAQASKWSPRMELDPNIARARKPLRAGTEGAGLRMEGPDPGIARDRPR